MGGAETVADGDPARPDREARRGGSRGRLVRLGVVFVVLFGVCLTIALHEGRVTPLDYAGVPANARYDTLVPKLGIEDPHFYLRAGYDIAQAHGLPSHTPQYAVSDDYVLNFWPPGMPLYYAALFTVFGNDMPVGVVAAAVAAFLWAALLTAFVDLLARSLPWLAPAAMVGLVLLTGIVQDWMLGRGVLWSEGLFTWCVLAAAYAAVRVVSARSRATALGWAATVGVLLGACAYLRSVGDLLGWLMLGLLAVWSGLTLVRSWWRRRRDDADDHRSRAHWRAQLLALLVCAVAFQIVTVPWRVYAAHTIRPGNYAWSTESDGLWRDSWIPDRVWVQRNFAWYLAGGPNTACHVDRSTCRRIAAYETRQRHPYSGHGRYTAADYRRLAVEAMVHHPVAYATDRLDYLGPSWFLRTTGSGHEFLENGLLTLTVLAALALSVRRLRRSGPDLVALLYPGLTIATMAPFVFIHFEARYFFPVKLVSVVMVFVLLALDPIRGPARAPRGDEPSEDARPSPEPVVAG